MAQPVRWDAAGTWCFDCAGWETEIRLPGPAGLHQSSCSRCQIALDLICGCWFFDAGVAAFGCQALRYRGWLGGEPSRSPFFLKTNIWELSLAKPVELAANL